MLKRQSDSDRILVGHVLSGNRDEFGRLVERYLPVVHAIAYGRVGNHADADDIAQDTFVKAFQALDTLRDRGKFGPWLIRITRNTCVNLLQKRRPEVPLDDVSSAHRATPPPNIAQKELQDIVYRHVLKLDEGPREVLLLHYYAGRTTAEIAAILEISREAAKKRLQRARDLLGRQLVAELRPASQEASREKSDSIMSAVLTIPVSWQTAANISSGTAASAAAKAVGQTILAKKVAFVCLIVAAGATGVWTVVQQEDSSVVPPQIQNVALPSGDERIDAASTLVVPETDTTASSSQASSEETPTDKSESQNTGPGVIRGRLQTTSGDPIVGAKVVLQRATVDGHWVYTYTEHEGLAGTDETGRFVFTDLPLEAHEVMAYTFDGLAWEAVSLNEDNPERMIDLYLESAGPLSGTVIDSSGTPIQNAEIYPAEHKEGDETSWHRKAALAVTTDTQGQFRFEALWLGHWLFDVRAEGYATRATDFFSVGDNEAVIVLDTGAHASGQVVEADTGASIPGVKVQFASAHRWENAELTADGDGRFEISRLAPGEYGLRLNDDYWAPVGGMLGFDMPDGKDIDDIIIRAAPGAVVSGRIYDADTGESVPGVSVTMECRDLGYHRKSNETDETGIFQVTALTQGAYTVNRSRFVKGYPFPEENWFEPELSVMFGQEIQDYDIVMSKGLSIAGRVADLDGRPLAGVQLRTFVSPGKQQYESSADDGSFKLMGYTAGDKIGISADKDGFAARLDGSVTMTDEDIDDFVITMEPEAIIEGIVMDRFYDPIPSAMITAIPEKRKGFSLSSTRARLDGTFTYGALHADKYELRVRPRSSPQSEQLVETVEVGVGEHVSGIRLVYGIESEQGGRTISGRVIDQERNPIEDIEVHGRSSSSPSDVSVRTDEDGAFLLTGLKNVSYRLSIRDGDRILAYVDRVPAGSEDVEIVVAITEPTAVEVSGRVLDAVTSRPVTDFEVTYDGIDFTTIHNEQGRFRLANINVERDGILIRASGYVQKLEYFHLTPDQREVADLLVQLKPAARVEGTVIDSKGARVVGAAVFLGQVPYESDRKRAISTQTADNGTFVLDMVNPAGDLISVTHPDYAPASVVVTPGRAETTRIQVVLTAGGTVEGTIRFDGRPVPGSLVWVNAAELGSGGLFSGNVEVDGTYQIAGIPSGSVQVGARLASGHAGLDTNSFHQTRSAFVDDGHTTKIDFDFETPTSVVEGIVTVNGVPHDASVTLSVFNGDGELRLRTSAELDGVYRFDNVPAGTAVLKATADRDKERWVTNSQVFRFQVGKNEVVLQDVELVFTGQLVAHVSGARDEERLRVDVYAGDMGSVPDGAAREALYGSSVGTAREVEPGIYRISGLAHGLYTVVAYTTASRNPNVNINARTVSVLVEVPEHGETVVDLAFD